MGEPSPKPINLMESGMDTNGNFIIGQPDMPFVLRDKRGRVVWGIPGNSPEDNEQLGIRNVQGLLLEKIPELRGLFSSDGTIYEDRREEARRLILEKCSGKDDFTSIFGNGPVTKRNAPYFEGSHSLVLKKTVESWGINFLDGDFNMRNTYWSKKSEEEVIAISQTIFKEKFPEFEEMFPRGEDGKIAEDKREEAEKFILGRIGSRRKIKEVFSNFILQGRMIPYFKGGYAIVVKKLFILWGLEFESLDIRVNKDTGIYTDKNGENWVCAKFIVGNYGISYTPLGHCLQDVPSIKGRGKNGEETILYNQSQALQRLNGFLSLPRVSNEADRYVDENGESWVTISYISRKSGLSLTGINPRLKNVRTVKGRDSQGRETVLLSEKDLDLQLHDFSALPQVDLETGAYTDQEGGKWVLVSDLSKILGVDRKTLTSYLKEANCIKCRDRGGRETILYDETEIIRLLEGNLSLPQVDKKTGMYVDESGERWASIKTLSSSLGLAYSTIVPHLETVKSIEGKDKMGKKIVLYNEAELTSRLKDFLVLPQVDRDTGVYVDENGESWVVGYYLSKKLGVNLNLYDYLKSSKIRCVEGRDKVGRKTTLYHEKEAMEEITRGMLNKGNVSPEEAIEDLMRLFEEEENG